MSESAYKQETWDLDELGTADRLADQLAGLRAAVENFEGLRPKLTDAISAEDFSEVLAAYEQLVYDLQRPGAYASLAFSADTQSDEALSLKNRVEHALTEFHNRTLFFCLWWKQLEDDIAARLLDSVASHHHRHFLTDLRRVRPYVLGEESEQIINLKDAHGVGALVTLYSMLANRLEFTLEVDGEEKKLTRDELMSYVHSPRPELRQAAYDELFRVFEREAPVLGQIYAHRVHDWAAEQVGLRSYASPIAVRNVDNDLPDTAVDTLLDVCVEQRHVFQRYFQLKAKWLGYEGKLPRCDIYAPIEPSEKAVEYSDAVELVLDTFADFSPEIATAARRVFEDGHIDAEVRKGKRGGAFCLTVTPDLAPWILANYNGKLRDVATLAHELGHAVHSILAEDCSVLTQHPVLPLAETASVFSEILLTERLLGEVTSPEGRRELLASAVDDAYATVLRQAYFVLFEREAHEAIVNGSSSEEVHEIYARQLGEQFGDAVDVPDSFRHEWVSIPHLYHWPFYCYAYSFGQLLVLALYQRYREQGDAFKPGYLKMLAYGGSATPAQILGEVGIDPGDAEFWRGGFALISEWVDELESLSS